MHACAIGALVFFVPALAKPHSDWVLAYLVEVGDGASGHSTRAGAGTPLPMPPRSAAGPLLLPARPTPHKAVHRPVSASRIPREYKAESPDAKVASLTPAIAAPPPADSHGVQSSSGPSRAGSSTNAGDGSGSDRASIDDGDGGDGGGTSLAHADYGNNPPPAYPAIARRRDQQGTVTLRVLIGADGGVERAEIAESSGFDALDDSALETVRRRWRFVPARRDRTPVESWVLVPIRFTLTETHASR